MAFWKQFILSCILGKGPYGTTLYVVSRMWLTSINRNFCCPHVSCATCICRDPKYHKCGLCKTVLVEQNKIEMLLLLALISTQTMRVFWYFFSFTLWYTLLLINLDYYILCFTLYSYMYSFMLYYTIDGLLYFL